MQLPLFELGAPRCTDTRARAVDRGSGSLAPIAQAEAHEPGRSDALDLCVAAFLQNARAHRTRQAYASDWQNFERWCQEHRELAMPASSRTLARYLAQLATSGRKLSSIRRARVVIGLAHAQAGHARPDAAASIRVLERGIGRELGTRQHGPDPLRIEDLEHLIAISRDGLRDCRDRALLLVGFAGAFRASELAALRIEHALFDNHGLRLHLLRSKQDQLGHGSWTFLPTASRVELCPVRALRAWLEGVGCSQGPLFRIVRGERIESAPISTRAVTRAVQRLAKRAGVSGDFSAHSLRSGLATSAYARGALESEIQAHGRWKDRRSLDRYIHIDRHAAGRQLLARLL